MYRESDMERPGHSFDRLEYESGRHLCFYLELFKKDDVTATW